MAALERDKVPAAAVAEGLTRTRAKPATSAVVEERIAEIAVRMRAGLWNRGVDADAFAEAWGVATSTARDYTAEAWRRVCAEADDATKARPTIAGTLATALAQSAEAREHKTTAQLADVWSRVVGARAPEKHEHAVVVAQYDALPRAGKIAWLRERSRQLAAEADRIEADERG